MFQKQYSLNESYVTDIWNRYNNDLNLERIEILAIKNYLDILNKNTDKLIKSKRGFLRVKTKKNYISTAKPNSQLSST